LPNTTRRYDDVGWVPPKWKRVVCSPLTSIPWNSCSFLVSSSSSFSYFPRFCVSITQGFNLCAEAFCWLPLSSVIENKILVLHGGLFSDDATSLKEMRAINRNCQPPDSGARRRNGALGLVWCGSGGRGCTGCVRTECVCTGCVVRLAVGSSPSRGSSPP
jgi:hypothetical protein